MLKKLLVVFILLNTLLPVNSQTKGYLSGNIVLDDTWSAKIYLSEIRNFEDLYRMSYDMLIAENEIDSLNNFKFQLNNLPKAE